jgi:hypothetical protein
MVDDDSNDRAERAAQELLRAGLPQLDPENRGPGGFGLQVAGEEVWLVWVASESLRDELYDQADQNNFEHPVVRHVGAVGLAMAEAMAKILRSAGLPANLGEDLYVGSVIV